MKAFWGVVDSALSHGEAIVQRLGNVARTRARDYVYGWKTARDLVEVAGSGAVLWLLYRRKRAAVPFSIATAAVVSGLSAATAIFDKDPISRETSDSVPWGAATPEEEQALAVRDKIVNAVMDCLPNVMGALSLVLNPETTALLNEPLDLTPRDPLVPFTRVERVRNLVSLYCSYTIVGHWLEMLFCQLIKLGVVGGEYDRSNTMLWDWWLHPFPAEGIAGALIVLFLSPLRERLLSLFGGRVAPALAVSFLANQLACTSIDYLTGMVANRNYELWDYREMPFNFQGQVCLQNSLVYTTAATILTWLAVPARESWLRRVPTDAANLAFSALAPAYALLHLIYFV